MRWQGAWEKANFVGSGFVARQSIYQSMPAQSCAGAPRAGFGWVAPEFTRAVMLQYAAIRPRLFNLIALRTTRIFATRRVEADEAELAAARKWLANLDAETIRKNAVCDISFSRSSGPGGQNVNKVSSKATLRIPTPSLLPLLPTLLHPYILSSRYHAAKTSDLVIQADDSRKQTDNVNACFRKLHDLITTAGREAVPGETSAEQVKRVEGLEKKGKAQRRMVKEFQSKKKGARRRGGGKGDD